MSASSQHQALNPEIVQQAIEWMVKLQSGTVTSGDIAECELWQSQSSQHEQAWQQLESLRGRFSTLPNSLAHATLDKALPNNILQSRRTALKSIAILVSAGTLSLSGYQFAPWQQMVADYGTKVGEQRTIMLTDGTQMMLNTDSAVDIHFDDQQRLLKLLKGEVLIITGHNASELRPFSVQTAQGNVRALGTRFIVRQQESTTFAAVYQASIAVHPDHAMQTTQLKAGQQITFSAVQTDAISQADPNLSAWSDGVIVASNMRLIDFASELDRYRSGKIICDASTADLKISGVFPINSPDHVIALLEQTLPIRAETRMRYWTVLHKRS